MKPTTLADHWHKFTLEEKQQMVTALKHKFPNSQIGALPFVSIGAIHEAVWLHPYEAVGTFKVAMNILRKLKSIKY